MDKLAKSLDYFEKLAVGANVRRMMQLGKAKGLPVTAPAARQAAMYQGGAPVLQPNSQLMDLAGQAKSLNSGPGVVLPSLAAGRPSEGYALLAEQRLRQQQQFSNQRIQEVQQAAPNMPSRWQQAKAVAFPGNSGLYATPPKVDDMADFMGQAPAYKPVSLPARVKGFFTGQPAKQFQQQNLEHQNQLRYQTEAAQQHVSNASFQADVQRNSYQRELAAKLKDLPTETQPFQANKINRAPKLELTPGGVPDFYSGPEPTDLYKGTISETGSLIPRVLGKPGDPTWYSGHPEISTNYAKGYTANYEGALPMVLQRPQSAVTRDGALGPFTRHTMQDARQLPPEVANTAPVYNSQSRAQVSAEAETPYYERVGTMPSTPRDYLKGSKVWRPHPTIPNQLYQAADFTKFSAALDYFRRKLTGAMP